MLALTWSSLLRQLMSVSLTWISNMQPHNTLVDLQDPISHLHTIISCLHVVTASTENMLKKFKKYQLVETLCSAACGLIASLTTKQYDCIPASSSVYHTNHSNLVHHVNNNSYNRETSWTFPFSHHRTSRFASGNSCKSVIKRRTVEN